MVKFHANGLKRIMLEKKLTENELATMSKINSQVVRQLIEGSIEISAKNILILKKVLDTTFEHLIFNETREPICLNLEFLTTDQITELIILESNFKKLSLKNVTIYASNLKESTIKKEFDLSNNIYFIRKFLLGLTQEQFSSILNVSKTSVYAWEAGLSKPTFSHLFSISKLTGFTIDCLYGNTDDLEISAFGLDNDMYDIIARIIKHYESE